MDTTSMEAGPCLTDEQLAQFNRDGFLVLSDFWSKETVEELKARMDAIVASFDPEEAKSIFTTNEQQRTTDDYFRESGSKVSFFFEERAFGEGNALRQDFAQSINKVGHALHDLDLVFTKHSYSPRVLGILKSFHKKPSVVQSMWIFKPPRIGGEVNPHQDGTFLRTEPQSCVGLWWAVEECTTENGCLWAVPGSHKQGVQKVFRRRADGTGMEFAPADAPALDTEGAVPLEVAPGTLVVLHGAVTHYSAPNLSAESRQAYSIHAVDREGCDYPEANWLQRTPELPFKVLDLA